MTDKKNKDSFWDEFSFVGGIRESLKTIRESDKVPSKNKGK